MRKCLMALSVDILWIGNGMNPAWGNMRLILTTGLEFSQTLQHLAASRVCKRNGKRNLENSRFPQSDKTTASLGQRGQSCRDRSRQG